MSYHPFIVRREAFFTSEQLAAIEESAIRILEEVGIAVLDEDTRARLAAAGFRKRGNRIHIEPTQVSEFLEKERARNGHQFSELPEMTDGSNPGIHVSVSPYPQWVHDLDTDAILPFTTQRLIKATKLLHVLGIGGPAGCPSDVPPALQPIVQYWVAATVSQFGGYPTDPKSAEALPYMMEMAKVMDHPMRSLPIYIFSPLTLCSESLRCVLDFMPQLSWVGVSNMPSMGCTAPIHVGDAYALSAAEVVGSAILLYEILDLPIGWSIGLFPVDLRTLAMVFGSPENFLLQLTTSEVNAYFHGTRWQPSAGNIHTNAKLPGAQACTEKASLMTAGALLGARNFGAVGTLSLDEVFSAEQLLYDLEIRDHVQRLVRGIDGNCVPDRCLEDVKAAIEQQSFVATEMTLNSYRDVYWHPRLFERGFLAGWQGSGARTIRQKARVRIEELLAQHEYELAPDRRQELDRIMAKARRDLAG